MNVQPVRVLLIEDSPADAALIRHLLADGPCAVEPVARLAAGLERLAAGGVEVVLLDLLLSDGRGLEALAAVRARAPDVPVVVLTGPESDGLAARALQQGAQDYLAKDRLDGQTLARAVRYARERKRLEREVCLLHKQRLEGLEALAGGVAHDFNNLLTGILGNASLALMDLPPDSPAYEPLRQIEAAALRAAELTRQLLAYSGKGKFVVQPVNLSRLIEEIGPLLQGVLPQKAVLRAGPAADVPAFEADAEQVRQVVLNLVSNAAEALDASGGVVTLRTGVTEASAPFPAAPGIGEAVPAGRYIHLEVEDTGHGMDEATRRQMFEPFFSTKPGRPGLGLPAVLGIVRSHNGAIQVDSEPGRGTTVRVLFPVDPEGRGSRTGERGA